MPCHNEAENLPLLIPEIINKIPRKYDYEIICADDGSSDETPSVIISLAKKNKKVKGVLLYRNFGHQAALRAGIKESHGDAVITMDADFQHPPQLLPKLIQRWEAGHDLVRTKKKVDPTSNLAMKVQRKIGYFLWQVMTDGMIIPGGSDFRLMSKSIAQYIKRSHEREILLRGNVMLASKNPVTVPYEVAKRKHGKSSYSFNMFLNMFVRGFISFSPKPLRIAFFLGLMLIALSVLFISYDIVVAILTGRKIIEGWTTVIFFVTLLNAFTILYLGILGEYIGVIFREVKKRPKFLIDKKINL